MGSSLSEAYVGTVKTGIVGAYVYAGAVPSARQVTGSCWRPQPVLRSGDVPPGRNHFVQGDRGAGQRPSRASTPHQPAPDLKAQLLTLADLPPGWSIDNSNSADNTDTPSCYQRFDSELHTNEKANASFVKGSDLPAFDQAIGYFGSNATARSKFSTGAAIFNGCNRRVLHIRWAEDHWIDDGDVASQVGYQSQAWDMTFTAQGTTSGFDLVLMQKGAELESLIYGDLGTPEVDELQTLAKSAADKMP
jgi:hypothetical protein